MYIINIPDITTTDDIGRHIIKSEYKNFEHNSLILNIAEGQHKFYAVNDSGDITFVNLQ